MRQLLLPHCTHEKQKKTKSSVTAEGPDICYLGPLVVQNTALPISPGKEKLHHQQGSWAAEDSWCTNPLSLLLSEEPEASSYPTATQLSFPDRKPGPPEFQVPIRPASPPQRKRLLGFKFKTSGIGAWDDAHCASLIAPQLCVSDRMVGAVGQAEGSFSKDISPINPHSSPQWLRGPKVVTAALGFSSVISTKEADSPLLWYIQDIPVMAAL